MGRLKRTKEQIEYELIWRCMPSIDKQIKGYKEELERYQIMLQRAVAERNWLAIRYNQNMVKEFEDVINQLKEQT